MWFCFTQLWHTFLGSDAILLIGPHSKCLFKIQNVYAYFRVFCVGPTNVYYMRETTICYMLHLLNGIYFVFISVHWICMTTLKRGTPLTINCIWNTLAIFYTYTSMNKETFFVNYESKIKLKWQMIIHKGNAVEIYD